MWIDVCPNKLLKILTCTSLPILLYPHLVAEITPYSLYVPCHFWLLWLCRPCSFSLKCPFLPSFLCKNLLVFKNHPCQDSQTPGANELAAHWLLCSTVSVPLLCLRHSSLHYVPDEAYLPEDSSHLTALWTSHGTLLLHHSQDRQVSANNRMNNSKYLRNGTPHPNGPLLRTLRND